MSTKRCAPLLVLLSISLCPAAMAIEFGHLRGLQKGAIGDSPQFHEFGKYEAEGAARLNRTFGSETTGSVSDTKVSGALFKTTVAAGGGMAAGKNFSLSGYVDFTLGSDFDEERKRLDPEVTLDTGGIWRHEFSGFGVFRGNGIIAGGGLGLLIIGSEDREFTYKTSEDAKPYASDVSSAAMPLIRIFGGVHTKAVTATLGIRFFSQGTAVVEAQDPTEEKYEYDVARRNPGSTFTPMKSPRPWPGAREEPR